jgi:hypothetical protein
MDDQDSEMYKNIQKYVADEDLIAAIGEIKGGPGSSALLGGFTVSKAALDEQRRVALSNAFMETETDTHSNLRGHGALETSKNGKKKVSIARSDNDGNKNHNKDNFNSTVTVQEKLMQINKKDAIAEKLLQAAMEKKKFDKTVTERTALLLGLPTHNSLSMAALPVSPEKHLPPPLGRGTGSSSESRLRTKLEALRNGYDLIIEYFVVGT